MVINLRINYFTASNVYFNKINCFINAELGSQMCDRFIASKFMGLNQFITLLLPHSLLSKLNEILYLLVGLKLKKMFCKIIS